MPRNTGRTIYKVAKGCYAGYGIGDYQIHIGHNKGPNWSWALSRVGTDLAVTGFGRTLDEASEQAWSAFLEDRYAKDWPKPQD